MKFSKKLIYLVIPFLFNACCQAEAGQELSKFYDPIKLREIIDKPDKSIWIIDVRTPEEYRAGHIPTSKLFPLQELEKRFSELPKDKKLILYCRSGRRSSIAYNILKKHGYKDILDWGGIYRWTYSLE